MGKTQVILLRGKMNVKLKMWSKIYRWISNLLVLKLQKKKQFFMFQPRSSSRIKKTQKTPFFVTSGLSVWTITNGYLKFSFAGRFLYRPFKNYQIIIIKDFWAGYSTSSLRDTYEQDLKIYKFLTTNSLPVATG